MFYREQKAREDADAELKVLKLELAHELTICADSDIELVNCMQMVKKLGEENEHLKGSLKEAMGSLKELTEAAEPVANLFEPPVNEEEPRPLVIRLRDTPSRLVEYVQRMARSIPNQVLSFIRSFYPGADLSVVAQGVAADCSDEKLKELMAEMVPIAEGIAQHIKLQ